MKGWKTHGMTEGLKSIGDIIRTDFAQLAEDRDKNQQRLKQLEQWLDADPEELGFVWSSMIMATFPHSEPKESMFVRENGNFTLTLMAAPKIGLPYGTLPRLLMSWMTTEALRTQSKSLLLGNSLSAFMRQLDIVPTGGRWGTIDRLKVQMTKLFACHVSCIKDNGPEVIPDQINIVPVEKCELLWNPWQPHQKTLWESEITLNDTFFNEVMRSSIAFKMSTLKFLRKSPMAIDLYWWATYRNFRRNNKRSRIPWEYLQSQFGANYPKTSAGLRDFKANFKKALTKVSVVYPEVKKFKIDDEKYFIFVPGNPDVPPRNNIVQIESKISTNDC